MRLLVMVLLAVSSVGAWAQTAPVPQTRLTYEDLASDAGHTLVLDGKAYGPYKDILLEAYSTSGTVVAFEVSKRDRLWILAQGKETGPLPPDFDVERLQISDDGRVWVLTATRTSPSADQPTATMLWVNGKSYGPYPELTSVEYSEVGGGWIAAVRTAADEADVLVSGKAQGPFFSVDHAWITPDGRAWGYATTDSEGKATVVTSEKTWDNVLSSNFTNLYPREPHWGYALVLSDDHERIVVDGQTYEGYRNFQGLLLTPSGRHWAFEAVRTEPGAGPVVVIDGKEYPGENLTWSRLGAQESYTWLVRNDGKVAVQTLKLPDK